MQRIAGDLFSDDFRSVMDKDWSEVTDDLKSYSTLTQTQGQIRLLPGVKKNLKAFIQWARDEIRMSRDPSTAAFPVGRVNELIRRAKTHEKFVKASDEAIKPKDFKVETKWPEWLPTLVGYLRQLPGRDGVPLSYVVRENDDPDPTPKPNFLDEYVACAPLHGDAYDMDNPRVANIILGLIVGNDQAETKIQAMSDRTDGREMMRTLNEHYAGVGIYANDIIKAESILANLFYAGEKPPHMWWDEFERQLNWAFSVMGKDRTTVYKDDAKIRKLTGMIKADFLAQAKTNIQMQANRNPPLTTYAQAMLDFRAIVRTKHPHPATTGERRTRRQVNEVSRGGRGGGGGRHRNNHGGRGRGGRGGHRVHKTRTDSEIITLQDGRRIEYHPSFRFSDDVMRQMTNEQKDKLRRQRQEYRERQNNRQNQPNDAQRQIQQLQAQVASLQGSHQSSQQDDGPPQTIQTDNNSVAQISQVTAGTRGTTMMGGRNDRANRR